MSCINPLSHPFKLSLLLRNVYALQLSKFVKPLSIEEQNVLSPHPQLSLDQNFVACEHTMRET
jgi:hypothetical protein